MTDDALDPTCTIEQAHFCRHAGRPNAMSMTWGHPRCICGPDHTGEAPDYRPDCPRCNPPVGPDVEPNGSGCYGWPRACSHYDDLACMDAQRAQVEEDL